MKNYLFLLVAGTLISTVAFAEEKMACPKMDEMMKKCATVCAPGASHKALDPLVGNWNAEVQCWMKPGSPATVTKGTAKSRWILNGRFIQEDFKGEFMGKPFRGIGILGYDNQEKKYNHVWIDDVSTSMLVSEGSAKKGANVITLQGEMNCPMMGQKNIPVKQVVRILSPDKHVFEMYMQMNGKSTKTMQITYTRK